MSSQIRAHGLGPPITLSNSDPIYSLCSSLSSACSLSLSSYCSPTCSLQLVKPTLAVSCRDKHCGELARNKLQNLTVMCPMCVHMRPLSAPWRQGFGGSAWEGQGACSCVVVFYEAGREDGDSLLPRVGLEKRNKERVLIKEKSQSGNSRLILFFWERGWLVDFYRTINHYPQV